MTVTIELTELADLLKLMDQHNLTYLKWRELVIRRPVAIQKPPPPPKKKKQPPESDLQKLTTLLNEEEE